MTVEITPTTEPNEFTVPSVSMMEFMAAVTKVNKKAVKLGCAPIVIERLGETEVEITRHWEVDNGDRKIERSRVIKVPATRFRLIGETPKIGDYEFLARVEYLGDDREVRLFHTVPGMTNRVDERFKTLKACVCEHCNKTRTRKDTFIVRHAPTGEQKQVGRQCLNDFTGLVGIDNLIARASVLNFYSSLRNMMDGFWSGTRLQDKLDVREALAFTSVYISLFGWVPKSAAGEGRPSTAGLVWRHYFRGGETATMDKFEKEQMQHASSKLDAEPLHFERADATIAWVKNELSRNVRSDYEQNLVALVSGDLAEAKHAGIVCSALSAWQRATNRQVEYAKKQEVLKDSKPVGTMGERLRDIPVTVLFVKSGSGAYGPTTMVKFVTDDGNVLTWFASGDREYTVGAKLKITATIKRHNTYNGVIETQVSRVS